MNAVEAVRVQRDMLLTMLAGLFAAAGIVAGGAPVATLPKPVRLAILRVLVPAESALRRLIMYVAERTSGPLPESRASSSGKDKNKRGKGDGPKRTRAPLFRLFDKQKFFPELSAHKQRVARGPGPQIRFFDERDVFEEPEPEKSQRDPDDALRLCRRLQALFLALNDIQGQADRLRRMMAKARTGPKRYGARRPGLPPGYRPNHVHAVDELLFECDRMARTPWPPRKKKL